MAPEKLIETWTSLYERANKRSAPKMVYARGWYKIPSQFMSMRRAELELAIAKLQARLTTPKETSNV